MAEALSFQMAALSFPRGHFTHLHLEITLSTRHAFALGAALLLPGAVPAAGQSPPGPGRGEEGQLSDLAIRMASMSAVTGYERALVDTVLRLLPGSARDRAGNAWVTLGAGKARRLVVCPLDEPGYVVGSIRDDGYLTLRRVPGTVGPLFDQQLEGHRVTVEGRRAPVQGVVAVRSIHLTRGRTQPSEDPFTVDDAYVDVGAATRAEVASLGISVLAPVNVTKRPHIYGNGLLAAPVAGRRGACAALLATAREWAVGGKPKGSVIVGFVVGQELGQRGLATLANTLGPFDETLIVDGRPGPEGMIDRETDPDVAVRWPRLGTVRRWSLPARYNGTVVETVSLKDAESLRVELDNWAGGAQ